MMEKSINEVVKEFKEVFGMVEFKATNNETGQIVESKSYAPVQLPRLEIDGQDYIAIGHLNIKHAPPSEGVLAGMMRIATGRR